MVYNINGTEYLLIHIPITGDNSKKLDKLVEQYNCIIQDLNVFRKYSLFSFLLPTSTIIKASVLVPSKNILDFTKEI